MAGYNEIRGLRVKYLSDDPSGAEDGQVWYNSATGNLRVQGIGAGAWSSSASMITGRYTAGSFGIQTAAVVVAGSQPPTAYSNVEEYNGTGFSAATAYPAAGFSGSGAGTETAGLIAAGRFPGPGGMQATSFEYDGSSWSPTGSTPGAMDNLASCGTETQSNVIFAVGRTPASGNSGTTTSIKYNGSVFSGGPSLNTARMYNVSSGAGTGTAGLVIGGFIDPSPNAMTNCEEFDGSSWTNTGALNVATGFSTAFGTQTDAVTQVNTPDYQGSEQYNGSTWTALPDIGVASPGGLYGASAGATGDSGMISAMSPTWDKTAEWNFAAGTVTAGAWSSATAMPEKNYGAGSFGSQDAYLYFGGSPYPAKTDATREYDGTNWTTTGNYTGSLIYLGGCGTQTAGLGSGGFPPAHTAAAEYDGSSWTAVNSMSQARMNTGSTYVGIQTAALVVGGDQFPSTPRSLTACEEYDGTNWSTGGVWPTPVQNTAQGGTQAAGWAAGGLKDSSPGSPNVTQDATNEYNGTAWTGSGALPTATMRAGSAGTQTAGLLFAGINTANTATSYSYDGTAWATNPSMATARQSIGGAGVSSPGTAAIGAGGYVSPNTTTAVEEFTGETSTAAAQTITVS